ncbi:MAG: Plug and carboxypeptidase regulatory-like domain-containing protein, partial [Acidobacteriota bacterium]|nr:Plug and carboxypeptidase regulatory-like domain-containing protein [Acidobacteriota bacterium]
MFQIRIALSLFFASGFAWGQLTRGFISGTVQDPSGSIIPGATVKTVNSATNLERLTTTNDSGLYRFVGIEPGTYSVEFTKAGFETKRVQNIEVSTAQEVTINQILQIGQTTNVVEVQDSPPGVELSKSSATIERTLPMKFIQNVPLTAALRDVNQLALLAPTSSRGPGSTGISANGQRARNNNFMLDGIDNNDPSVTIANNRAIPEAISEFQVQTAAYSAEYGRNSGAQILASTRGGTNQFHGEAFDYYNGNWLTPVTLPNKRNGVLKTPRFNQNQAGGDFGGPVIKNRTFFFALLEANRRREAPSAGNATSATIPTPAGFAALTGVPLGPDETTAGRQAALGTLGFLPSIYARNPGLTNVRNVTVNGSPIQFGTVSIPLANPSDFWYGTARIDHHLSARDNIFYRVTTDHRTQPDVVSNLEFGSLFSGGQEIFRQNHVISETHVFSPRLTNQFSFGYIRGLLAFPENDPKSTSTGISGAFDIGGLSNFPQGRVQNEFQFTDSLAYQVGRHALKVGADI